MSQKETDIESTANRFRKGAIKTNDEAIQGARDIIAEWVNENEFVRQKVRRMYQRKSVIASTLVKTKKDDDKAQKYQQYFDWNEPLDKAPSHRLLAILRAQNEGFVRLKVDVDKEEALDKEPLLPESILNGAGYYAEYRTDDARLTIEVLKTALNYDAKMLNYVEATDFIYEENRVVGAKVKDNISNNSFNIKAKYVVNATGPWVDNLRQKNHSKQGKRLHLTKGVHLVVAHDKLPVKQSVYFDIPDGRMMFAIPRGKVTYFGTTDTNYQEDKNNVETNLVDATYLISAVNNMFPDINLTLDDVQSSWAGLRPLIHEE